MQVECAGLIVSLVTQVRWKGFGRTHDTVRDLTIWPHSPRLAVQCAPWAANGHNHLGLCARQWEPAASFDFDPQTLLDNYEQSQVSPQRKALFSLPLVVYSR